MPRQKAATPAATPVDDTVDAADGQSAPNGRSGRRARGAAQSPAEDIEIADTLVDDVVVSEPADNGDASDSNDEPDEDEEDAEEAEEAAPEEDFRKVLQAELAADTVQHYLNRISIKPPLTPAVRTVGRAGPIPRITGESPGNAGNTGAAARKQKGQA